MSLSSVGPAHKHKFILSRERLRQHSKSRTGCLRCKARKVKCGEEKPGCRNCLRIGSLCQYASPPIVVYGVQAPPVEHSEMRAWNYFIDHHADASGVYYYGETVGPWLEQIPARALHFPSLKSAILAFSTSCAGHVEGLVQTEDALLHRRAALKHLHILTTQKGSLKKTEKDAVAATCLLLRFQSFFLDDGYTDMLILRRMTWSLAAPPDKADLSPPRTMLRILRTGDPEKLAQARICPNILQSAMDSLDACLRTFHNNAKLCKLCFLMTVTVRDQQANTIAGLKSWRDVYLTVLNMSPQEFQELTDGKDEASRVVLAHYFAVLQFVTALTGAASTDFAAASLGRAANWIVHVCRGLENHETYKSLVAWPLQIASLCQQTQDDRPPTLGSVLVALSSRNNHDEQQLAMNQQATPRTVAVA